MTKDSDSHRQVGQYDKVIKENLESTLPVIIKDVLGLDIAESEEIADDLQHTKERKPDLLKRVTDSKGFSYILQVEFQVKNEREMPFRMCDYHVMLLRQYKLPVKQYVIFLKDSRLTMPCSIDEEDLSFRYKLVRLSEASYKIFLNSNNPEVKMLGLLSNFESSSAYEIVGQIVKDVQALTDDELTKSRYFEQMRSLVNLRKSIKEEFKTVMETVTRFFKKENDFLYIEGVEEEREKAAREKLAIARTLKQDGVAVDLIAKATGLSVEIIKNL